MLPLLVGTWLRLHQLPAQVLVDDEWHMVHALRDGAPLARVVTDFGTHDHSVGMSLSAWLLMRVTPVDEMGLRAPAVMAGILLLVLVPILVRRIVGHEVAVVLAWLLAVSPVLCFFGRLARPYAVTTLLVGVAVPSFHRWFVSGGRDRVSGRLYLVSAALGPLFHLAALPALLAPFGLVALARHMPPPASPSRGAVGRLLVTTLVLIALVLLVPLVGSADVVVARVHTDHVQLATIPRLLELLAGTGSWVGVAALGVAAAIGVGVLGGQAPLFAAHLGLVIAVQVIAVLASGVAAVHVPLVAARYVAVVLPLGLIFPAAGLAALALHCSRIPLQASALGAAALLLAIGPLRWIDTVPNEFTNHVGYQADYVPGRYFERFRPYVLSAFYTDVLAQRAPGTVTIVEAPWHYYFHDLAYLQRVHRQHVLVGFVGAAGGTTRDGELAPDEPGLVLRRAVHLGDRAALRARHVDFVVLHRDVTSEIRWPTGVHEPPVDVSAWDARYREWFGAPIFADAQLTVFATTVAAGAPTPGR